MSAFDERIEKWWPHVDIKCKHEILTDLDAPLSQTVLEAVAHITGHEPGTQASPVRLSEREKDYIRTQMEPVD